MPAIELRDVSKKYRIHAVSKGRIRDMLPFGNRSRFGRNRDFWVLRDVNLKVEKGVSLGLLGRNGAGKSTLLQVVSGVLKPTSGRVITTGKISALLRLGAGFNTEYTGRENVMINGLILGIDRKRMLDRMDEIEEFAGIGEFMDQPVKSYSSGMRARLGFAVAVNVEPDILLVDETLSVGDGIFKQTGIQKMKELQSRGATIIFVSHSASMVKKFCTEAAVIHEGRLLAHGGTAEIGDYYQAMLTKLAVGDVGAEIAGLEADEESELAAMESNPVAGIEARRGVRHGTGEATIEGVEVLDERGHPAQAVSPDSRLRVRVRVRYRDDTRSSVVRISLRDRSGIEVFSTSTNLEQTPLRRCLAGELVVADFDFRPTLRHGTYGVAVGVSPGDNKKSFMDWLEVGAAFEVERPPDRGGFGGMVHLPTEVSVTKPDRRKLRKPQTTKPSEDS